MKNKFVLIIFIAVLIIGIFILLVQRNLSRPVLEECILLAENTVSWKLPEGESLHTVSTYSLGKTAEKVMNELQDIVLTHKFIDDISLYEMRPSVRQSGSVIFFIPEQDTVKEDYIEEMVPYAQAGYICVVLDIEGYGERFTDEELMNIQAIVDTGNDLNTLIEYYKEQSYADANHVAIVGFSQGGSIAYWYAAYGKYPLSALVVGITTPNYTYYIDDSSIKAGVYGKSIWTEKELYDYIDAINPVNNLQAFNFLPILSGHGMNDSLVSTKGDEEMELYLNSVGNENASFYYYDGVGHEVPEEFIQMILPFLNKYLRK